MKAAGLWAPLLAVPILCVSGCQGTSSGVDNPEVAELRIDFRDAEGTPMRVSGNLDVFGKDQNPALYPEPLATIKVLNNSMTHLSSEDFERIGKEDAVDPLAKRAATPATFAKKPIESPVGFNVVFRSDARTGSVAFDISYDPKARAFLRSAAGISGLELRPAPLVRYAAVLARKPVHGDLGRVFIPGTPFLATLSDSAFVLEDLPEGVFGLRLLAGDGNIYAIKENLDTRVSGKFTAVPEPMGRLDSTDTMAQPLNFSVAAAGPPEAFANTPALFDARITGVEPAGRRASYLWRQIDSSAPGPITIKNPVAKGTEILFPAAWVYTLEVTVTIGATSVRDTLIQKVRDAPIPPKPRILNPRPGDSLAVGMPYKLSWEMPAAGTATVEIARGPASNDWERIATDVPSIQGMSYFAWTPPDSLAPSLDCLLRVRLKVGDAPDSLVAVSEKPFGIVRRTAPAKP